MQTDGTDIETNTMCEVLGSSRGNKEESMIFLLGPDIQAVKSGKPQRKILWDEYISPLLQQLADMN